MLEENDFIDVNRIIKLQFEDGTKLDIQIFDGKLTKQQDIYLINHESPLAKAIMKRKKGEKIKFKSDDKIQEVTILEIYQVPKHLT